MSNYTPDNHYTEEEKQANSRADTLAMFAIVAILVGLAVFTVATF